MEVTSQRLQARGEKLEAVSHRLLTSSFKLEVGDGEGDGKRGERDREREKGREGGRETEGGRELDANVFLFGELLITCFERYPQV